MVMASILGSVVEARLAQGVANSGQKPPGLLEASWWQRESVKKRT
jgi:hypothetical protein